MICHTISADKSVATFHTAPMIALTKEQAKDVRTRLTDGCGKLKSMIEGLLDSQGRVADEVHAIRKLGKSLRGGCALLGLHKNAGRELQCIGRLLSSPRDAVARLETWNKLGWDEDKNVAAAIRALLEQGTHAAARRPPRETADWCIARVDKALKKIEALDAGDLADRASKGFRKLDKRAFKRCRKLDRRRADDFHQTRKALKAWLGAVDYLPAESSPYDPGFHGLAKQLGDENDLATLSLWLDGHGFTRRFAPGLWHAIERNRKDLQLTAVAAATAL